jgi:excinuclease UvrABC nuclease subunit
MENKEKAIANDYLRSIVMNLPETPGIYQYLDSEGTIIYVGKAKNLKRRVYSYFAKEPPESAGAAVRHGKAYREIFQIVKAALAAQANGADSDEDDDPANA